MAMAPIRTRIAPSPTGSLHIGTARTALFNFLFARKQGGAFVLRVEDTDIERSDEKYERDIFEGLAWLGITADEGPEQGGAYGPYRQSERAASYRPYLEELLASGRAYYCPHTEAELDAEKKELMARGQNPVHGCRYRDGGAAPSAGSIIRFKTPAGRALVFNDLIRGDISFGSDLVGDFSIAKDLAVPLYNFAVVIDDHEMRISHVIRGEDHISNTPKQMLLAEALGLAPPIFAHLPLILGTDRSKLSKRHGATSVREFREQGYLAEALVNFMALLGGNSGGERELFSMDELIREFDLGHIQKAGAVFDTEKLDWMNGEHIRRKSARELTELCLPYLTGFLQFPTPNDKFSIEYIEKIILIEQPRLKKLSEVGERTEYFFREPDYPAELLRWKNMPDIEVQNSLERSQKILEGTATENFTTEKLHNNFMTAIGAGDKGALLWPLRIALTGKKASPGPFEILAILGKDRGLRRIERALAKIPA